MVVKSTDSRPMEGYKFPCDPIANPKSVVSGPHYRFTILNDKVLRYEWAEDGQFEDRASTFALWRNHPKPDFRVKDTDDLLEIVTPTMHLTYNKQEFSSHGFSIQLVGKTSDWIWRFGESSADGNLGGTARTLDGVDGRCDMGLGILSRKGAANLDDSESMLYGEDGFVTPRRPGKRIDGYFFAYGLDFKGAMEYFYAISGRQPSVPRWALGNWWSRYHAYDADEYLNLMDKFHKNDVPLSVAVLDMDWHWVHEPFVPHSGWTGYSWNTNLFPDPKAFAKALHDRSLKITLNDHPHQGVHSHEDVYEELANRLNHDTTNKDPILFDPTSRAFMQAYFSLVHRRLENLGCDFWWIDWQQGTHSRIPGFDPLWLLNHFQYLDTQQQQTSSASHSLIFSRYAGPGSHRYPLGFSGDTLATWASLHFQPEFTATASNIGFGWWSHDIGGHMPGSRDDECTVRWVQLGVWSPILRLHSTLSRWMSKEPWKYRAEYFEAIQGAMQLRHRLVPYIYSYAASSYSILPLIQPLYWSYPDEDVAYRYPNSYTFGPSLLVAPITTPRNPATNLAKTKIWLPPKKRYVDIFTGTIYSGDREINFHRPLEQIPVLAPEGSIIPLDLEDVPDNGCRNPLSYELLVVIGQDAEYGIIEDPQDDYIKQYYDRTKRRIIKISYNQEEGRLTLDGFSSKEWKIRFISAKLTPDIQSAAKATWKYAGNDTVVVLRHPCEKAIIDVGPDPQLSVLDHKEKIGRLLLDWQMGFEMKDRIWEIVEADQPMSVKMGGLMSLGWEEDFLGPIVELLGADSRT